MVSTPTANNAGANGSTISTQAMNVPKSAGGRHRQDGPFACGAALVQFRGQIAGPKIKR
jgi:hypothetical protein